ncbi:MAG: class I SAM-dependent methyltransferase [bacterium]
MASKSLLNPTTRFSDRVEHYVKYRPGYSEEVVHCLKQDCGLSASSIIADVGSGTGLSAEIFLKSGPGVFGIEPNEAMRSAAEKLLAHYPAFQSVDGTAEKTTLDSKSVDFIIAAQAFHWFENTKTRSEFLRILKPEGWVVLLWNDRRTHSTPFLRAYERLLVKFGTDYKIIDHKNIVDENLEAFFGHSGYLLKQFGNRQVLDFAGLKGRVLSSSYAPGQGHPAYEPMLEELRNLFDKFQTSGHVEIEYDTKMYYGRLL